MVRKYLTIIPILICGVMCRTESPASQRGSEVIGAPIYPILGTLGALGSMVPGVVSNLLPMVFLFGLGALMVPALGGLGLLLREGRRSEKYYYRSFPTFNINTSAFMDGVSDLFDKVIKALDNVDKKYK